MFRYKIAMTPVILGVVGFCSFTMISCVATSHETLNRDALPSMQEAAPAASPSPTPTQSATSEPRVSNPGQTSEPQEQVRMESSANPVTGLPVGNMTGLPIKGQESTQLPRPAGAIPSTTSLQSGVKGESVKTGPMKNPSKSNLRETRNQQKEETERDIMEEALVLLDESQKYWVNGELEDALQMLDQAYALLLDTNGNPDIVRQKDDLRLIISKRILAIYNSLPSVAKGKRGEIPIISNPDVEKEIRLFQTVERDFFISSYQRSMIYRPVMVRELKKAGLPEELSWLPLVESGYKINALSSARALGLWQFIPSTGYKYGLNRDEWADERMDVEKSTRAAIDYFKDLHAMFGDWLTVLAGYNCGEGRVMRTIASQHINYLDRFWDLYQRLPYETARYVPRFLATLLIVRDPQKYGMDLGSGSAKMDISSYAVVEINRSMRLQDIALKLDAPEETLNILNAELRHRITPDRPYKLKVPAEKAELFAQVLPNIPQVDRPHLSFQTIQGAVIRHKVRQGETLDSIAQKYKTSVGAIRSANKQLSKKPLVAGLKLNVPLRSAKMSVPADKQVKPGNTVRYKVQKGDTLASLARKHDISIAEIRRINDLKNDSLMVGQTLRFTEGRETPQANQPGQGEVAAKKRAVASGAKPSQEKNSQSKDTKKQYTVKQGDSLNRIARENNISLEKLLTLNRMAQKDPIRPGQVILIQ